MPELPKEHAVWASTWVEGVHMNDCLRKKRRLSRLRYDASHGVPLIMRTFFVPRCAASFKDSKVNLLVSLPTK